MSKNLTDALDGFPATKLKGDKLQLMQQVWLLPQVTASSEAEAAGRRRLLAAVAKKRRKLGLGANQEQEGLREAA